MSAVTDLSVLEVGAHVRLNFRTGEPCIAVVETVSPSGGWASCQVPDGGRGFGPGGRFVLGPDDVMSVDLVGSDGRTAEEMLAGLEGHGVALAGDAFDVTEAVDNVLIAVARLNLAMAGERVSLGVKEAIDGVLGTARHLNHCRVIETFPPGEVS